MKKILLLGFIFLFFGKIDAQWMLQSSGTTERLDAVFFTNVTNGIAVGDTGTIIRTSNGGQNWMSSSSGVTTDLLDVFSVGQIAYAAGKSGVILKSTDSGSTWTSLNSGTTEDIYAIHFISETTGWAAGINNTILSTTDGGQNWVSISGTMASSSRSWYSIHAFNNSSIQVTGSFQSFAATADNGGVWLESQHGSMVGKVCCAITCQSFPTVTEGFMVANSGDVLHTVNAGLTWSIIDSTSLQGHDIDQVSFPNTTHGWAVGDENIMHTTDAGISWNIQTNPSGSTLNDVFFLDNNIGYIVGSNGTIMKTTNGSSVGIFEPESSAFAMKVFPNPSQGNVQIEVNTIKPAAVKVFLTDLNGNKLLSQEQEDPADFHTFTLEKGQVASGVYLLNVVTESEHRIEKLLLID